ncbi:hypothetical protein P4E94_18795 [Pontiellaceae bacterium B12219]|nr:hypothetical protein [Pontiellaceae bacterium B12219]
MIDAKKDSQVILLSGDRHGARGYALLTGKYPFRANAGRGTWRPLPREHGLIIPAETCTNGGM